MTTSTPTPRVLTPALRQTDPGSRMLRTEHDFVLKVGDRRYGIGATLSPDPIGPWSVYLFRQPVVIGLHAFPETVEQANLGDVIDLGWMGRWEIVEERIPGGRVQDMHVVLRRQPMPVKDYPFDDFWEESE